MGKPQAVGAAPPPPVTKEGEDEAMATQAETQHGLSLTKTRDWLAIAAAIAVVIGALAAGMQWAVSSAVAPLVARMDRMENRMERIENQLDVLPELRERLTRVETILLEREKETP